MQYEEYKDTDFNEKQDVEEQQKKTIYNMMKFISKESESLLDLGDGTEETSKALMNSIIEYWGVDYVNSKKSTVMDEYNKGEFPQVYADTVFCVDCLEYIENIDAFLEKMCKSSKKEIIITYCPLEYEKDVFRRKEYGWKNHLKMEDLLQKFQLYGFSLSKTEKNDNLKLIMKWDNKRRYFINLVSSNKLTYLEKEAMDDLMKAVVMTNSLEGCLIETGCALGGSGICLAHEKRNDKELIIYDVFGMIPEPGENDGKDVLNRYEIIKQGKSLGIGGDTYYGYQKDLLKTVENNFCSLLQIDKLSDKKIQLVKGLFQDTLVCKQPVALAHIDCDWYDSVMVCLKRIVPQLVQGGILVIDDYYCWSGCRKAVDDYFQDKKERFVFEKKSRLHIIKK